MPAENTEKLCNPQSNLDESPAIMASGDLSIGVPMNGVSDAVPSFYNLIHMERKGSFWMINEASLLSRAVDKATMHLKFLASGIDVLIQLFCPLCKSAADRPLGCKKTRQSM